MAIILARPVSMQLLVAFSISPVSEFSKASISAARGWFPSTCNPTVLGDTQAAATGSPAIPERLSRVTNRLDQWSVS